MKAKSLRKMKTFQSTPPVKAATANKCCATCGHYISIHAAREGGDCIGCPMAGGKKIFQSTPPVKAATLRLQDRSRNGGDFNPRRP